MRINAGNGLKALFQVIIVGVLMAVYGGTSLAAPLYSVEELPVPPGTSTSVALAINDSGRIIGYIIDAQSQYHGAVWFKGKVSLLDCPPPASVCFVRSINERGQIGMDVILGGGASIWDKGQITPLALIGEASNLYMINDAGHAVGMTRTAEGLEIGTLWRKDIATFLNPLPGFANSQAQALNNRGQAVGLSESNNDFRATLWHDGQPVDLGIMNGYTRSQAIGINNRGDVIGLAFSPDRRIGATLWKDGQFMI